MYIESTHLLPGRIVSPRSRSLHQYCVINGTKYYFSASNYAYGTV